MKRAVFVFLFAFVAAFGSAGVAQAAKVHGVDMPSDASNVGEDRFRTTKRYSRTIRHFSRKYSGKGLVWRPLRGNPRVKGVHIANHRAGRTWDGINVYEADGKVHIYVLKAKRPGKKKR